jgi:hypothetical protein
MIGYFGQAYKESSLAEDLYPHRTSPLDQPGTVSFHFHTMHFPTLLTALALFAGVQAAAPLSRELVESIRADASALDKRGIFCEIPLIGPSLCDTHCSNDHDNKKGCTGKCNSKSVSEACMPMGEQVLMSCAETRVFATTAKGD